ncbi:MAG: hypothetical protein ACREN5_05745, partial [Gemmatimonadales bacterium]
MSERLGRMYGGKREPGSTYRRRRLLHTFYARVGGACLTCGLARKAGNHKRCAWTYSKRVWGHSNGWTCAGVHHQDLKSFWGTCTIYWAESFPPVWDKSVPYTLCMSLETDG